MPSILDALQNMVGTNKKGFVKPKMPKAPKMKVQKIKKSSRGKSYRIKMPSLKKPKLGSY